MPVRTDGPSVVPFDHLRPVESALIRHSFEASGRARDLGNEGAFAGGEAELTYAVGGARLGVVASIAGGTGRQTTVGLRLRSTNVWIGVELTATASASPTSGAMETSTTAAMFGFGLSGNAGKKFGLGEAYALYGALSATGYVMWGAAQALALH